MELNKKKILFTVLVGIALLIFAIIVSVTYGAKAVSTQDILDALLGYNTTEYNVNVVRARIPRTIFGIVAGMALAISGALMQSVTRNPIADPSILGVNTGASLFVVFGIAYLNITSKLAYISLAFMGALMTAILVYKLASMGYGGATPMKLALSGAAVSTALSSLVSTIMMPSSHVMDSFRFWQIGSIGGTDYTDIRLMLPVVGFGVIASILLAPGLNILALGDENACALGLHVTRTRAIATFVGVLLCAVTTALAGPIGFLGLMIPHLVRLLTGPNHCVLLPLSALFGGSVLLLSDVLGRVLGSPGELESGIMTALIGAPCFIWIIRRTKVQNI